MNLILLLSDLGRGVGGQHQLPAVSPLLLGDGHLHLLRLLHPPHRRGQAGLVVTARPAPRHALRPSPAHEAQALTAHPEISALQRKQVSSGGLLLRSSVIILISNSQVQKRFTD